jgi:hypothetical protein
MDSLLFQYLFMEFLSPLCMIKIKASFLKIGTMLPLTSNPRAYLPYPSVGLESHRYVTDEQLT